MAAVAVDRFCDLVRADFSLQETLRQPDTIEELVVLVLNIAHDHGIGLDADDVKAATRGRPVGMPAIFDTGDRETGLPPAGWLPYSAFWREGMLYVQWTFFGTQRLLQPLFEFDIRLLMQRPFNQLIRYTTPITALAEWLQLHPPQPPAGFIFHMSRCGSTLVAQMLAALSGNVVISESSTIDAVVRAQQLRPDLSDDEQALWLRWIIGALGRPRTGSEHHLFIKFDALHTLSLPLLRRAFPDTPWIFLSRHPVEVLMSHLQAPGIQVLAGSDPYLSGIDAANVTEQPEEFCAQALARICGTALDQCGWGKSLLLDYQNLPEAVWTTVMPHFGVACSDHDRAAMANVARYDAKTPSVKFESDREAKQQKANAQIRAAAGRHLASLYRRLETLEAGGS